MATVTRAGAVSLEGQHTEDSELSVGRLRALAGRFNDKRRKQNEPEQEGWRSKEVLIVKSKVKQTAGKVTNNPSLETQGKAEQYAGKVEKKVGQVEKVFEK